MAIIVTASLGGGFIGTVAVGATCDEGLTNPCCYAEQGGGWGMGGQNVSCVYHCKRNNFLTVHAHAHDADAFVTGTTSCGGLSLHCDAGEDPAQPSNTCSESGGLTATPGQGGCSATSSEFWDSGIHVLCEATKGLCADSYNPAQPKLCLIDHDEEAAAAPLPTTGPIVSAVHLFVKNGIATGFVCNAGLPCVPVVPICIASGGVRTCTI